MNKNPSESSFFGWVILVIYSTVRFSNQWFVNKLPPPTINKPPTIKSSIVKSTLPESGRLVSPVSSVTSLSSQPQVVSLGQLGLLHLLSKQARFAWQSRLEKQVSLQALPSVFSSLEKVELVEVGVAVGMLVGVGVLVEAGRRVGVGVLVEAG